jgi:hypothetical protein
VSASRPTTTRSSLYRSQLSRLLGMELLNEAETARALGWSLVWLRYGRRKPSCLTYQGHVFFPKKYVEELRMLERE